MKKLGLTLVAVAISASVFATGSTASKAQKWDGAIASSSLSKYLQLESGQQEEVSKICEHFVNEMEEANSSKRFKDEKLRKAIYGNLKVMKQTLNEKQYASYVRALSATLRNKGISF